MKRNAYQIATLLAVAAATAIPVRATAQDPTNTNPADRIVYRGDRTTGEQAESQLACYNWGSEQTGWDPVAAYAVLEREHGAALQQYSSTQGSAVGGAARGALAGLAIGAIAGDAGTGAAIGAAAGGAVGLRRGRKGRASAEQAFEAAATEFKTNFKLWDRYWVSCMIGNGYGVA